jgi:hypothetical protein
MVGFKQRVASPSGRLGSVDRSGWMHRSILLAATFAAAGLTVRVGVSHAQTGDTACPQAPLQTKPGCEQLLAPYPSPGYVKCRDEPEGRWYQCRLPASRGEPPPPPQQCRVSVEEQAEGQIVASMRDCPGQRLALFSWTPLQAPDCGAGQGRRSCAVPIRSCLAAFAYSSTRNPADKMTALQPDLGKCRTRVENLAVSTRTMRNGAKLLEVVPRPIYVQSDESRRDELPSDQTHAIALPVSGEAACTARVYGIDEGSQMTVHVEPALVPRPAPPPHVCRWTAQQCDKAYPCPAPPASRARLVAGIGLLSAGIPMMIVSGVLGYEAHAKNDDARNKCGGNVDACPAAAYGEAMSLNGEARAYRAAAYWGLGIGGAAVIAGAGFILSSSQVWGGTSSSRPARTTLSPTVTPNSSGLAVSGTF